jgi:hypothetical protein
MNRRTALTLTGSVLLPTAGCLQAGESIAHREDAVHRVSRSAGTYDRPTVNYGDLTDEEQAIIQTSLDSEYYHACPPLPEAVQRLGARFGEGTELRYQETRYLPWFRIADEIITAFAPRPETVPSCGLL